jgi:hypothetical protein
MRALNDRANRRPASPEHQWDAVLASASIGAQVEGTFARRHGVRRPQGSGDIGDGPIPATCAQQDGARLRRSAGQGSCRVLELQSPKVPKVI